MTDSNGWPDASKPGYPMNPERDGEHMMEWTDEHGRVWREVWKWRADSKPAEWQQPEFTGGFYSYEPKHLTAPIYAGLRYLGPCNTPADVTDLIEAARREEREAVGARLAVALDLLARRDMTCAGCCGPSSSEDEYEGYLAEVTKEVDAAIRARGDA
jgi:hypothetical protein